MQKRSHTLLASALLRSCGGFSAKHHEWVFLLGSVQPDCNPFTYLKGSLRGHFLRGHNFSNSSSYIFRRIHLLQAQSRWDAKHYYILGKLTHYLADAFTYPHNPQFPHSLLSHHRYERQLRSALQQLLSQSSFHNQNSPSNPSDALARLHQTYSQHPSTPLRDAAYIMQAVSLLRPLYASISPFTQ